MHNKSLIRHYTGYVNNFAEAMHTLERSIIKKPKFVEFLKSKFRLSKTSLSLQGLLLKPIQRFPQYILFLTVSLCDSARGVCEKVYAIRRLNAMFLLGTCTVQQWIPRPCTCP